MAPSSRREDTKPGSVEGRLPDAKGREGGGQEALRPEADQLQRDVVGAPALVRQRHQPLAGPPWRAAPGQAADLVRPDLSREAVGAEHQRVPATERQRPLHLDRHVLREAQGPEDDVGARVVLGLGRAEHAAADQFGHERVILGQLTDLTAGTWSKKSENLPKEISSPDL